MSEKILEIKDLHVDFEASLEERTIKTKAVCGTSLSVRKASFTSIVGESGSGKSVTVLSICRLLLGGTVQGTIDFYAPQKTNLLDLSNEAMRKIRGRKIAYIFQDPSSSLNPVWRVGPQIDEAYKAHFDVTSGQARTKSIELLEALRIREAERVYRSYPHELSGGMRQRAMIAMSLISEPELLIADEPTTALDAVTEIEIMKLILDVRKERNLTVLFITHDLSLAAAHSDVIHVMQEGRVLESMEKKAGLFEAKKEYSKRLFKARLTNLAPKTFIETK